jgi:hypothetical protein
MRYALLPLLVCLLCGWIMGYRSRPGCETVHWQATAEIRDVAISYPETCRVELNLPRLAQMPAPLAEFFLMHEQAHLQLGHASRVSDVQRRAEELAADCWAAARVRPEAAMAAVVFFLSLGAAPADHPTGRERAAEIERCGP